MSTGLFLGGSFAPLGATLGFLDRKFEDVCATFSEWRVATLKQTLLETASVFPECLSLLEPLEAPWSKELLIDCGEWTCYLNNHIDGGDLTGACPYVSKLMGCRCVIATHVDLYGPGHASTQLSLLGPNGAPPLMYVRTIVADAADGKWYWETQGPIQDFENTERYKARTIPARFPRELLVEYLRALGIRVDEPAFYGVAQCIQQVRVTPPRTETLEEARRRFGLSRGEA